MTTELEVNLTENFGFRLVKIVQLISPFNEDQIPTSSVNLLAWDNLHDRFVLADHEKLILHEIQLLETVLSDDSIEELSSGIIIKQTGISHIAFNATFDTLIVVVGSKIYTVDDFNLTELQELVDVGNEIKLLKTDSGHRNVILILTNNGELSYVNLKSKKIDQIKDEVATFEWVGDLNKLIVATKDNKLLNLSDPQVPITIETPSLDDIENFSITHISMINDHIFLVIYTNEDNESLQFLLNLQSKEIKSIDDILPLITEFTRDPTYYQAILKNWNDDLSISFVASALSPDILTMTAENLIEQMNDPDRAQLPLNQDTFVDSIPVGLAVDITNRNMITKEISATIEDPELKPLPRLVLLTHDGKLCVWHIFDIPAIKSGTLTELSELRNLLKELALQLSESPDLVGVESVPVTLPKSTFAATDKLSPFGTSTDKPSPFGTTTDKPSPFGTATDKPSPFGTATDKPSPFASLSDKPSPFGTTTDKPSPFGTTSDKSSLFASLSDKPSPFGTTDTKSAPAFGSSLFGSSDKPAFGAPAFGSSDKPAFGAPAFGSSTFGKSTFGSSNKEPSEAANSLFSSNTTNSAFGSSTFGSAENPFSVGSTKSPFANFGDFSKKLEDTNAKPSASPFASLQNTNKIESDDDDDDDDDDKSEDETSDSDAEVVLKSPIKSKTAAPGLAAALAAGPTSFGTDTASSGFGLGLFGKSSFGSTGFGSTAFGSSGFGSTTAKNTDNKTALGLFGNSTFGSSAFGSSAGSDLKPVVSAFGSFATSGKSKSPFGALDGGKSESPFASIESGKSQSPFASLESGKSQSPFASLKSEKSESPFASLESKHSPITKSDEAPKFGSSNTAKTSPLEESPAEAVEIPSSPVPDEENAEITLQSPNDEPVLESTESPKKEIESDTKLATENSTEISSPYVEVAEPDHSDEKSLELDSLKSSIHNIDDDVPTDVDVKEIILSELAEFNEDEEGEAEILLDKEAVEDVPDSEPKPVPAVADTESKPLEDIEADDITSILKLLKGIKSLATGDINALSEEDKTKVLNILMKAISLDENAIAAELPSTSVPVTADLTVDTSTLTTTPSTDPQTVTKDSGAQTDEATRDKQIQLFEDDELLISRYNEPVSMANYVVLGSIDYPDHPEAGIIEQKILKMIYYVESNFEILNQNIGQFAEFLIDHQIEDEEEELWHTKVSLPFPSYWRLCESETINKYLSDKVFATRALRKIVDEFDFKIIEALKRVGEENEKLAEISQVLSRFEEVKDDFRLLKSKDLPFPNRSIRADIKKKIDQLESNLKSSETKILLFKLIMKLASASEQQEIDAIWNGLVSELKTLLASHYSSLKELKSVIASLSNSESAINSDITAAEAFNIKGKELVPLQINKLQNIKNNKIQIGELLRARSLKATNAPANF